jgi:Fe-S cluster assembly ATP-binding protein
LEKGKINVLMGPNGSGKSSLAKAIAGHPDYKISSGEVFIENHNITNLSPDKRAQKGLFLSFQHPQEIEGVSISNFLRTTLKSLKDTSSFSEFNNNLKEKTNTLEIKQDFTSRFLNKSFSGGEKKKSEILQLLMLNPKIIILDEIDSGLDIDALKTIAKAIKDLLNKDKNKTILIITHYKRILEYITPDKVFIIKNGQIIKQGDKFLVEELEKKGYADIE